MTQPLMVAGFVIINRPQKTKKIEDKIPEALLFMSLLYFSNALKNPLTPARTKNRPTITGRPILINLGRMIIMIPIIIPVTPFGMYIFDLSLVIPEAM